MEVYIWLGLMVLFLVVEATCPLHLVSIWFTVGALIAGIAASLGGPVWLQVTLFIVISGALLGSLWPLTKKFLKPKITKTNVDSIVGTEGYVTQDIDNLNATGQVKLGGMVWTARSVTGETIAAGTLVKVERIEGVKAFVTPEEAKVSTVVETP